VTEIVLLRNNGMGISQDNVPACRIWNFLSERVGMTAKFSLLLLRVYAVMKLSGKQEKLEMFSIIKFLIPLIVGDCHDAM